MTIAEALPWLNLLLIPAVGLLMRISARLARLDAVQEEHGRRLNKHDSDLGDLRHLMFD